MAENFAPRQSVIGEINVARWSYRGPLAALGGFRRQKQRALAPRQSAIGEINVAPELQGTIGSTWQLPASEQRAQTPRQSVIGEINVTAEMEETPTTQGPSGGKTEGLWLLDKVQLVK